MELEQKSFSMHQCLANMKTITKVKKVKPPKIIILAENIPEFVIGDEPRLTQVLLNLVSNAIKFSHKNSDITVAVTTISSTDQEHVLQFSVTDQGIGIDEENQSLLFQVFSQVDSSINRRFGGTGLGLSICQKIVALMGGTIWLEKSVPHEGSTFSFTCRFGVASSTSIAIPSLVPQLSSETLSTTRVLVAEDNNINRKVMFRILQNIGFVKITMANDGQLAFEQFCEHGADIVITDLAMPNMSGIELARKVKSVRNVPIIAVTANATAEQRIECDDAGMNGFITKPVSKDALIQELIKAIS